MLTIQSGVARPLLYQEVIDALYRLIDENQIKPGDKFPSERELVEKLEVSRNVLREAFHVLEDRGVIISKQGKGRFLRSLPKHELTTDKYESVSKNLERYSLLDAYEVRQVLEVKAVELIVKNASDEDIDELEQAYKKMEQKFKETNRTIGEFDLHRLYAKKTGNLYLEHTLDIVLTNILDMMRNTFHDIMDIHNAKKEAEQHRLIIDAIKSRNVELAKKIMYQHIQETIDMLN